ncbi:hypothetical protein WQQ_34820 [Hydrocarboniphaga effusa AP103]|uniref:Uncharacterized protein n=1 Tax=Hydrocarboniphaga effusa AP103 TaxID=1172194 RepID=I7Z9D2_9GAMM|nr:hypothetical protein WQQ_34820 [Hydrocarboniphaga effusa AP103]
MWGRSAHFSGWPSPGATRRPLPPVGEGTGMEALTPSPPAACASTPAAD